MFFDDTIILLIIICTHRFLAVPEELRIRLLTNEPIASEEVVNAIESPSGFNYAYMVSFMMISLGIFLRWTMFNEPASTYHSDVFRYTRNPALIFSQSRIFQINFIGWMTFYAYFLPFCSQRWNFPDGVFPGPRITLEGYLFHREATIHLLNRFYTLHPAFILDFTQWQRFYNRFRALS